MNLYFRLIWLIFYAWRQKSVHYKDAVVTPLIVLPTDLDLNMHMNNARYLSMMDLGRIDLMMRTGLLRISIKRKWAPVVANLDISYYKSLEPWERFHLESKLADHDEKYFFIEQTFKRKDGTVVAKANVKGLFLKGRTKMTPEEVIEALEESV